MGKTCKGWLRNYNPVFNNLRKEVRTFSGQLLSETLLWPNYFLGTLSKIRWSGIWSFTFMFVTADI